MIVAAFRSEWVKLKRRNLLVGSYVGLALAASLFAILLFARPQPAATAEVSRA